MAFGRYFGNPTGLPCWTLHREFCPLYALGGGDAKHSVAEIQRRFLEVSLLECKYKYIPVGCVPPSLVYTTRCQYRGLSTPHPPSSHVPGVSTHPLHIYFTYPSSPPLHRQTNTCENIIFPQLRWRAVTRSHNFLLNKKTFQSDTYAQLTHCTYFNSQPRNVRGPRVPEMNKFEQVSSLGHQTLQ